MTKREQAEKLVRSMKAIARECEEIFGAPLANWGLCPESSITNAEKLLKEGRVTKYLLAFLLEERNTVARSGNYVAEEAEINPLYSEWDKA